MKELYLSAKLILVSIAVCVVGYSQVILLIAQAATPYTANGYLVKGSAGTYIGSAQIAQSFTSDRYFWPRPSAVDYNAAATGGSNLSPTNPAITERAQKLLASLGATSADPAPADLVTASGSGVDPDITEAAALFQVPRVAAARKIPEAELHRLVADHARYPGGVETDAGRIVNVLLLNIALEGLSAK